MSMAMQMATFAINYKVLIRNIISICCCILCSITGSRHCLLCPIGSPLHGVSQWESATTMEYRSVRISNCWTSYWFITRIQRTVCSCRYSNWGELTLFYHVLFCCNRVIIMMYVFKVTFFLFTSLQFKLIIAQVLVVDFVVALLVDRILQFLLGKGTLRLRSWTRCQQWLLPLPNKL